jgi:c-di-AMP phosphodiesterase-like protein
MTDKKYITHPINLILIFHPKKKNWNTKNMKKIFHQNKIYPNKISAPKKIFRNDKKNEKKKKMTIKIITNIKNIFLEISKHH